MSNYKEKRHFAWKAGRNILATKDNLIRRKITKDATCVLCGQLEETTCHLLWFCKHAREVQESNKFALPFVIDQSWSFLDIIQNLQNHEVTHPGLLEKVISICWGIWKDRNERRMGGSGKPGRMILKTALHLVEEYSTANDIRQGDKSSVGPAKIWKPPDPERKGYGGRGVFARDVGIREAEFEGDSLIVCMALQGAVVSGVVAVTSAVTFFCLDEISLDSTLLLSQKA
uniref:Reverse transcriptase zinc-binding domain-containing protein n=1 Tax=Quercus lobata TaxID=97700 RepID=A0A7N2LEL5_QUELO